MALELIGRAIFNAIVPKMITEGLSFNAMIRYARQQGFSYQRTEMLSDIRRVAGMLRGEARVPYLSRSNLVPISAIDSATLPHKARYLVKGQVTLMNTRTGQTDTQWMSFYTNTRSSPEGWEDRMSAKYQTDSTPVGWDFVHVDYKGAVHHEGWTY